jgi:hypothetical protein
MNTSRNCCSLRPFLVATALLTLTTVVVRAQSLTICKKSDLAAPVTGTFTFLVGQSTVLVAVGDCQTFSIDAPGVKVTERIPAGTAVTNITVDPAPNLQFIDIPSGFVAVVLNPPPTVTYTNATIAIPVQGRFTGGGSIFTSTFAGKERVTHGFELQCSITDTPNTLEVNVGANNFHLDTLSSVTCTQDPITGVATITGSGTGTYNKVPGAKIMFSFTDAGEPGTSDFASYVINDSSSTIVLSASGFLDKGNQQFHPAH